jgi:hypothetical protein
MYQRGGLGPWHGGEKKLTLTSRKILTHTDFPIPKKKERWEEKAEKNVARTHRAPRSDEEEIFH